MNKKKKILLAAAVCVCIVAVLVVCIFPREGAYKTVHLEGYSISVPEDWTVAEETGRLVFTRGDKAAGQLTLLYTDHEAAAIPAALGYTPEATEVRRLEDYAFSVYEISFDTEEGDVRQYVIDDLSQRPPYQAVLTLEDINSRTAGRMLEGFGVPSLNARAPEKPLDMPQEAFFENAVYTVRRDTATYAYHLSRLDRLIQAGAEQPADEASVLHILSCEAGEDERHIDSWYYLSVGAGEKWLYTYEQGADGQYFYRNNPKLIRSITREVSEEEGIVRYLADGLLILEAPYNAFMEKKEVLLTYKNTLLGNNSDVSALVGYTLPVGTTAEGIALQTDSAPYGLTIRYRSEQPEQYVTEGVLEEKAFYQTALMLFCLIKNVDIIQMEVTAGEETYALSYQRQSGEAQFAGQDLHGFTADAKTFERFIEDVPKMQPAGEENSGIGIDGTRVLNTVTLTVSADARFKHPETGRQIRAKTYAERYGLSEYLDRPVAVTLHEKTDAGVFTLWITGECEGTEIGSWPVESKAEFDKWIAVFEQ